MASAATVDHVSVRTPAKTYYSAARFRRVAALPLSEILTRICVRLAPRESRGSHALVRAERLVRCRRRTLAAFRSRVGDLADGSDIWACV